ncbi:unnamed protein product [Closterium sp. Yama58-4]|nr:unnamed protein product [Closterium sp. Yama58-4]
MAGLLAQPARVTRVAVPASSPLASAAFISPSRFSAAAHGRIAARQRKSLAVRAAAGDSSGDGDNVVTLLDYGAGNVRSVRNAIRLLGYEINDVSEPEDILAARKLIFPGVGAFRAAMDVLNERGLADAIRQYVALDRPFLGICLGLQLLFDGSQEFGDVEGLGIIPGTVSRFDASKGLTVPQIGWNGLQIVQSEPSILDGVNGRHVYFVHSYRATQTPANSEWVLATANYGEPYVAAVRKGNVQAVQFHPEKSGVVGLDILRRFLGPNRSQQANEVEEACSKPLRGPRATQLAKRVIACLDVRANDRGDLVVTKGDQYDVREQGDEREVRNLGKPVELAARYFKEGADEVAFLNITGFRDFPLGDLPMLEVMKRASERVFVPLTVGGGIRDFTDANGRPYSALEVAAEYFRSGADKVSIGSEAVFAAEELLASGEKTGKTGIEQISYVYGNQAVVVSIDPKRVYVTSPDDVPFKCVKASTPGPNGEEYAWYQCTGDSHLTMLPSPLTMLPSPLTMLPSPLTMLPSPLTMLPSPLTMLPSPLTMLPSPLTIVTSAAALQAVEQLGAGEILLNCIDCDGQGQGFDLDLVELVSSAVSIPVIASSGAGNPEHFSQVFAHTGASAALAAGIFHRNEVTIESVKTHLAEEGVETRLL